MRNIAGPVRLQLQTPAGHWIPVGPFSTLTGAQALAEDLIEVQAVRAVTVESRHRGVGPLLALGGGGGAPAAHAGRLRDGRSAGLGGNVGAPLGNAPVWDEDEVLRFLHAGIPRGDKCGVLLVGPLLRSDLS